MRYQHLTSGALNGLARKEQRGPAASRRCRTLLLRALPLLLSVLSPPTGWSQSTVIDPHFRNDLWAEYHHPTTLGIVHDDRRDDPFLLSSQASAAIRLGHIAKGRGLLEKAIVANFGVTEKTHWPRPVSLAKDDLEHGREQVLQMLADRRVMLEFTTEDGFLVRWAIRMFAGEFEGRRIYWNNTPPPGEVVAQHSVASADSPAAIQLAGRRAADGTPLGFEELWASCVFELFNIQNAEGFRAVDDAAAEDRITREDYILENFRLEIIASEKTRFFYCRDFLVWAEDVEFVSEPHQWYVTVWGDLDNWIEAYSDRSEYPWSVYGEAFDSIRKKVQP